MTRSMCSFIIFKIVFIAVCSAGVIEVQDCSDRTNRVSNVEVDVSDCPSGNNCTLYKGNVYNLKTTFTPNITFTNVNMRVLGIMGILKIPHLASNEVCPEATTEDGVNCNPETGMLQGTVYTHIKEFPVRHIYPKISMTVRVEYYTGSRSTRRSNILCYIMPIQILNAPEDDENEI